MPWKECSAMDERLQFVASPRADGGTLQGVRHFAQDRLQDLRSLSGMWHSGAHGPEPPSVPLRKPTSFRGGTFTSKLSNMLGTPKKKGGLCAAALR